MMKKYQLYLSFLVITAGVFWQYYGSMPQNVQTENLAPTDFSTPAAFEHVKVLARQPHYVGTENHSLVRNYIVSELRALDLQVEIQEGYSMHHRGILTKPQNILARIEGSGNGKALLLLTHYDSAVHSSPGASDAASGVGTILEGLRAYKASGKIPLNDIIVVFTDGEELGLNGALLFVQQHPWAKDVGLALNFEARGSGGNSFMLLETNYGNKALIEHFTKADPQFPVTNSLAYSVYKMLPNDTDLTVLREENDINGFNFAFIDDHFDYHTAGDTPENLDLKTLAHQGSYLLPLLTYFSEVPLEGLNSSEDVIYFNVPIFQMISYPFAWIWPSIILAALLFIGIFFFGILKKQLHPGRIALGFVPLLLSLVLAGLLGFFLWKFCLVLYPEYLEMEHGFTYNGYSYIAAIVLLSAAICFFVYNRFTRPDYSGEYFVAPLFLWLLISALAAAFLEGAAYFVLLVYFGLLQLLLLVWKKHTGSLLLSLLSLPAIYILLPFISTFPVALGLKILFVSAILSVFLWTFLWPVFRSLSSLRVIGSLFLIGFVIMMSVAHFTSDFTEERPKPNSLVYLLDSDTNAASWNTYDHLEDDWTGRFFGEASAEIQTEVDFSSKYNTGFTKSSKAPVAFLMEARISLQELNSDSLGLQWFQLTIAPKRPINRIEIFTDDLTNFPNFTVNGIQAERNTSEKSAPHIFHNRSSNRLLTYFAADSSPLSLNFSVPKESLPQFTVYEVSHDLLQNEQLNVPPRMGNMIPRPFVINDAIVIKTTVSLQE